MKIHLLRNLLLLTISLMLGNTLFSQTVATEKAENLRFGPLADNVMKQAEGPQNFKNTLNYGFNGPSSPGNQNDHIQVQPQRGSEFCAVSPFPYLTVMEQPDGKSFQGRILTVNRIIYLETEDGYTVMQDPSDGYFKYAAQASDGNLYLSNIKVAAVNERSGMEKSTLEALNKQARYAGTPLQNMRARMDAARIPASAGIQAVFPPTGTRKALLLLIQFPDLAATYTVANFNNFCNQVGYNVNGQAGSFRDYYLANSYGALTINTDVFGWYTASNPWATYGIQSMSPRQFLPAVPLIREAVDAAEIAGVDYSQYDGDADGNVDVVMVIHSGRGAEESGNVADIWSHRWVLAAAGLQVTYDGKLINDYIVQAEKLGPFNIANIGVFAHEFGHALGLPDLYDADGGSAGLGSWCMMAGGTWNNGGATPANQSVYCKAQLGWMTPTVLSGTGTINGMNYSQVSNASYRMNTPVAQQYFLIENRQQFGWDAFIPGNGLCIYHIDLSIGDNTNPARYRVNLEQADGLNHLNNNVNGGDAADPFPGTSANPTFNCSSNPNTNTYPSSGSNVAVTAINVQAANTMGFSYGACAPNTISLTSAPGTDNQTVCINAGITNITYSTSGATGATFTGLPAGVTGSWAANVVTISGAPSAVGTFNYTVTLTGGSGSGTATGSITVITNTITLTSGAGSNNPTLCINTGVTPITYTTTLATGATFTGLPAGVTGVWVANVIVINGTPTVAGTFPYTVTLTGGCGVVTATGTITVNPNNTIALTSAAGTNTQTVCNNNAITNITYATTGATGATVTGLPAGVSGVWAANVVTISGTPTVAGTFPYTVTLTGGCGVITATGTITVNPVPNAVATPASQTICSAATITTIALTGAVPGTVYNWTRNNTATVTGIAASGAGNIAGSLTNTTFAPITVTFTVTPSYTNAGVTCTGTPVTATVLVNPTPDATATPAAQTICSGNPIIPIVLTSMGAAKDLVITLVSATWADQISLELVDASSTQVLSAGPFGLGVNYTSPPITATNAPYTFNIEALGAFTDNYADWSILCDGTTIASGCIRGTSGPACGTATGTYSLPGISCASGVPGTVFNWTRDNTATVTGIAASGTGNIAGTLTNTTFAPITVTFTITPTANGCPGAPITATVIVNPIPNAVATPAAQTICSGSAITTIALTGNVAGTVYSWTRDNTATVTGIAASGTGNIAGSLTNTTFAPITVTFTVVPTYTNGGLTCTGPTITATVIVNPIPNSVSAPAAQAVCSGNPIGQIVSNGNVVGTVYNWVRDNTATVTGMPASGTGFAINGTLINATAAPITVTFTVTPSYTNGGVTCTGPSSTATVTVTPVPSATISYAGSPYCSTDLTALVTRTGTPGGVYTASPAGLTINAATGTVTPNTSTPGTYTVTYTVAPAGGCLQFVTTTTITITAAPNIIIFYAGNPYCSSAGTATVTRFGTPGGTYTASPAGLVINAATGAVTLGTSTAGTYTVTYTVPAAGGCGITLTTTTITIIPAPAATIAYTGSPYCSNGGTANVTRTGTAGGTYSSTPGLTLNAATGAVTLGTSTPGTYTVTYTVVTAGGACPVFTTTTTITITALPTATISYAGNPYCQNAGTATVTRTGTAGGTYSAAPAGLTISATTGAVTLATSTPGTYTVTYTLAAGGGCPVVTATTSITITALPAATISYAGNPYCQNAGTATVTRTGNAGGTYSAAPTGLSINAATGTVTLGTSTPGTYTVSYTLAAAGGCPAVVATTTITVQSLSTAATAANASATTLCGPGTVTLSVTGGSLGTGASWKWYSGSCGGTLVGTGGTLTGVTVNSTTTFFVRAEGTCNTTTCASVTVTVNTLPTISLSAGATTLKPFETTTITATVTPTTGTTIIWYRNGVVVPGATGTSLLIDVDKLGTYTARATTTTGCTALSAAVTIGADPSTQLFITPNPNNGQFKVRFYTSANSLGFNRRIVMTNTAGQRVFDMPYPITAPYSSMDIDARHLPKGFYILQLMDAFGNEILGTGKVILQ